VRVRAERVALDDVLVLLPGAYLVLAPDAPDFTIIAVSAAYLRATKTMRNEIVGRTRQI